MTHTKNQFSKLSGMTSNALAVYIKRGKVVLSPEGVINDQEKINAEFLAKRLKKKKASIDIEPDESGSNKFESEIASSQTLSAIERNQKELQVQKTKKELQILTLKEGKLSKELIHIELVKEIMTRLVSTYTWAFKRSFESFLIEMERKKFMDRTERLAYSKDINRILNQSVTSAVVKAEKELKAVVEKFSDSRGRGEKK